MSLMQWFYRGGRPSQVARVLNRLGAAVYALGIAPETGYPGREVSDEQEHLSHGRPASPRARQHPPAAPADPTARRIECRKQSKARLPK